MSDSRLRNLVVVLGDQLDAHSSAFEDFDASRDAVWMAEALGEATHVWSHKARIALFFAAMRHFREHLRQRGVRVHYRQLDRRAHDQLIDALRTDLKQLRPEKLILVEPGEWRLREAFRELDADDDTPPVALREDRHFLCSHDDFADWMRGRRQPRMEHFYRWMRQRHDVLMEARQPRGGRWNFDTDNRESFASDGPPADMPGHQRFQPDALTREVIAQVNEQFADHPGTLEHFDWPLTRVQAQHALDDFITHRLPQFGRWQDAMWQGADVGHHALYHARLSAAMNLKLLHPDEVISAACQALDDGHAPLAAVEGFVRQVLGWREYVRGLYWQRMPGFADNNALQAHARLPDFYWTGDTDMNCLRQTLGDTLAHGYAHHIQRLMVTGLYALLLGVEPVQIHAWYLAIYVDAVEWVELPNVIGMSQWADGGVMASKPYIATGKYIDRMSNYCRGCRFRPAATTGPRACPVTVLYWDFLARHRQRFAGHPRLGLQVRNLERRDAQELAAMRRQADALRER
ncbi:cryptochrome/photolyase family protein [Oleiagrimonas sp. C23AA]|uniref:cryptochrome/photolyase family protein n=1 Tax=Oleiagrimonas sp. C23AA TaxID=2719047 RepID=UPI0014234089|nr:cryptochrome/photolyase family protein [Oleiagrimonas sp. C23AA]NII10548.1 cryptochrome/photolyase family protein [Oleiagrimonas sp. C23AA]